MALSKYFLPLSFAAWVRSLTLNDFLSATSCATTAAIVQKTLQILSAVVIGNFFTGLDLIFAAIRRAYAVPNFFDTCATIYGGRNIAVLLSISIGSIMPKRMGALCHVETCFEE